MSPAAGVIDMHVHPDPDVFGRALTDIELVTVAKRKGMGGMIEICYLQFMTGPNAQYAWMKHWEQVCTDKVVEAVRELGADNLVLSIGALRAAGVSQADIDKMMKRNPAKLLGLST